MTQEPNWLDDREQQLWRDWIKATVTIQAHLRRDMHATSGLSLADFEVLVHLTDVAEGRLRVSDLAELLQWERSRVSHQVIRMQRRDLVIRQDCPDDGRIAYVSITDAGREAIAATAPAHVEAVRDVFFSPLSRADQDVLSAVLRRILDGVDAADATDATGRV